jgi:hypothetical protein
MATPACSTAHGETMKRFGNSSEDLFGHESFDDMSAGEFFLMRHTLPHDCIERANWAMLNVPEFEGNRLLDSEDHILLDDALKAYIFGLYARVILSSIAFCERLLTDAVEIRGDLKSARRGFAEIIKSARQYNILNEYILDRILRLQQIRNNFCHEKGPDDPWRIFRRSMQARTDSRSLLQRDAKEALCIMRGIVGRIERWLPRQELPGHPSIRAELLRKSL